MGRPRGSRRRSAPEAADPKPPHPFLHEFKVVDLHRPKEDWVEDLLRTLGRYPGEGVLPRVLGSVFETALRLGAKLAVAEPYTSLDWYDEHRTWYDDILKDVGRNATRIHFFTHRCSGSACAFPSDQEALVSVLMSEGPGPKYLGYTVVRPYRPLETDISVGVTMLDLDRDVAKAGGQLIGRCRASMTPHLWGRELHVEGVPFIQQDQSVTVCAGAALWMVGRFANLATQETARFAPSETEQKALESSPYPVRHGLDDNQIYAAMHKMGLNPHIAPAGTISDALNLICSFAESGIPVILCGSKIRIGPRGRKLSEPLGHAITAIGTRYGSGKTASIFRRKLATQAHGSIDLLPVASQVQTLVVHDDSSGPYLPLRVVSTPRSENDFRMLELEYPNATRSATWRFCVETLIVPSRMKSLSLEPSDVDLHLDHWIRYGLLNLRRMLEKADAGGPLAKALPQPAAFNELRTRTLLVKGSQLKRWVLEHRGLNLPGRSGLFDYWSIRLPLYTWLVEFSRLSTGPRSGRKQYETIGEALFDPTTHTNDYESSLLALRLGKTLLYRSAPDPASIYSGETSPATTPSFEEGYAHWVHAGQESRPWYIVDDLPESSSTPYSTLDWEL
jgi:hypothetical protein